MWMFFYKSVVVLWCYVVSFQFFIFPSFLCLYYSFNMLSRLALLALSVRGAVSAYSNSSLDTTGSVCACQQLSVNFNEYLFYPNTTNYTTVNLEAWDTRSNLAPSCIFNPVTADEVAKGMKIISGCEAQFAIRGGGHMNVGLLIPALPYLCVSILILTLVD